VTTIRAASWIAGIIFIAAILVLTAHLTSGNLEFSRYNTNWNGTSVFFSELDRHHSVNVLDPAELDAYPADALLLIIAPDRPATGAETAAYRAFLVQGNTVILADDFGTGNSILRGVGSRIRIGPGNLSSIDRVYADPYTIVVYRTVNKTPVENSPSLVVNRAAPLDGGEPLMMTSIMSWIDANGDRRINTDEVMGTFAVISAEDIGQGRVVVISDPSIFINAMQGRDETWGNNRLIGTITGYNGTVLVDQMNSRTGDADGVSGILHVIRTQSSIELLFFGVLMLVAAWAWRKNMV
jgi:hypothetical protein